MLLPLPPAPLALTGALLLSLALDGVGCGHTCPTPQPCGEPSPGTGVSGDAGGGNTSCEQLTALQDCLDSFCQPSDKNPFCTCYKRGYDLGTDCKCTKFDPANYCRQASDNGIDAAAFDCSSATSSVASLCVGVQ